MKSVCCMLCMHTLFDEYDLNCILLQIAMFSGVMLGYALVMLTMLLCLNFLKL